jgi:Ulp1 family protease
MDSLGDCGSEVYLQATLQWLREMAIEQRKVSLEELSGGQEWAFEVSKDVNDQGNNVDCGVHAIMNIYCASFSLPLFCNPSNANTCRTKIALDLLRGHIVI